MEMICGQGVFAPGVKERMGIDGESGDDEKSGLACTKRYEYKGY